MHHKIIFNLVADNSEKLKFDISHMIKLCELSTIKIIFTWSKQAYHNYTILYTHYMYMYKFFTVLKYCT